MCETLRGQGCSVSKMKQTGAACPEAAHPPDLAAFAWREASSSSDHLSVPTTPPFRPHHHFSFLSSSPPRALPGPPCCSPNADLVDQTHRRRALVVILAPRQLSSAAPHGTVGRYLVSNEKLVLNYARIVTIKNRRGSPSFSVSGRTSREHGQKHGGITLDASGKIRLGHLAADRQSAVQHSSSRGGRDRSIGLSVSRHVRLVAARFEFVACFVGRRRPTGDPGTTR